MKTFRFMCARAGAAALLTAAVVMTPDSTEAQGTTAREGAVHVFLDCSYVCDQDYLRTEITYVNWVRDRTVADVHLLVTTQATGGSGTEYTLAFIGLRRFAGMADTLRYVASAANSADDTRKGLRHVMGLGLVRFAARTDAAGELVVSVPTATAGTPAAQSAPADDPWNAWTFRLNANTNFNGERNYESRYYFMSANASRITDAWKITFNANQSQNMSRFVFEQGGDRTAFSSFRRTLGLSNLTVRSLTPHWSAGLRSNATSSTYLNQASNVAVVPTIEYNIFPYRESTRRQLRLQYGVGVRSLQYRDTTIYGRIEDTKPLHSAAAALDLRQPWGTVSLSLDGQQYLDAPQFNRWSAFANSQVRLFKGFNLNFYGGYERLRDQIYISAQGATRDQILTRQRQLETGYTYWGGIGLGYTFGSIYNNVVNPRFGGSGGNFVNF